MSYDSIICISDLQAPFSHPDALKFLGALKRKYYINAKRTRVVNLGDEIDAHCLSRWGANVDGFSAGHEHRHALTFLSKLWDLFPCQDVCISNHTLRPFIRAQAAGIPKSMLLDLNTLLKAPQSVKWQDYFVHNDILFEHGENVSGPTAAINAARQNLMSTVIGHQHSNGGVLYYQSKLKRIFGLNTGCLIDVTSYAFDYGKTLRNKPTLGCGVILGDDAHFIPMSLNKLGRWVGKL